MGEVRVRKNKLQDYFYTFLAGDEWRKRENIVDFFSNQNRILEELDPEIHLFLLDLMPGPSSVKRVSFPWTADETDKVL